MYNLLSELGLQSPVYWFVSNTKGGGAFETDLPDIEYAKESGLGVFYAVNEFGGTVNDRGNRRHEQNATRATAFFVDFDTGTKEQQEEILSSFPLPPTTIIESGRGYHAYWIITGGADWRSWSFVQKSIALRLGGDTACSDRARLMRLPGSWHTKSEPLLVSVKTATDRRYTLGDFTALFPVPAERHFDGRRRPGRKIYLPTMVLGEGNRHPTLKRVVAQAMRGVVPSEVDGRRDQLKAWYAMSCRPLKEEWENEVDSVVDWIISREL